MFRNFKLSSLSIRGLDIKRIDYDTFHTKCCANTLETLDLSNNKLMRLDSSLLLNLKRLVKIDFSNNNLQFSDKNFEFNKNLKVINLSNNKLQYLPSRIFYNLNELELIDLSDNHLTSIDSCTFNNIQTNPIKRQFAPTQLSLTNNPIDCNCDIFYLNRYLNIKVNATCNKPREYFGRQYSQLKQEDPSLRCQYVRMAKQCSVKDNLVEIIVIILLACLAFLFCSISICCFCKNAADQEKFKKFKNDFEDKQKPKRFRPKPVYIDISTGILPKSKQQQQDTEKLLS
jgi:Leucine-rich repeat (LRR) protein